MYVYIHIYVHVCLCVWYCAAIIYIPACFALLQIYCVYIYTCVYIYIHILCLCVDLFMEFLLVHMRIVNVVVHRHSLCMQLQTYMCALYTFKLLV